MRGSALKRLICLLWFALALSGCQGSDNNGNSLPFSNLSHLDALDGIGTAARFNLPAGITSDGTNLYVADSANHVIRKIEIATAKVTTLAGSAGTPGSADGTGSAASFNTPLGIATDGRYLFVTDDGNGTIRKVEIATGAVTTLAGKAGTFGVADGTGASASFLSVVGIATDGTNLYVVDALSHTIRMIEISSGAVTTLAGTSQTSGSADGTGTGASFSGPRGITVNGGNLYVADTGNRTIRKVVIGTGEVTTLAGTAGTAGLSDGVGAAALFNMPAGITSDASNLYVTDMANHNIRQIDISTGTVTTLAGSSTGASGYQSGTGTTALFNIPFGITTVFPVGTSLYVGDSHNNAIRAVTIATGAVTTLAGKAP
jgi:hypothetical protein